MVYAGQKVRASDVEVLWARKTSDESVTSSTTLQGDDALIVPVRANMTYRFTALIAYTGGTAGDIKVGFAFPAGAHCWWAGKGPATSDDTYGTTGSSKHGVSLDEDSGTTTSYGGSSSALAVLIEGVLATGSVTGTLQLQWAQNTTSSTALTVREGSFLEASARS